MDTNFMMARVDPFGLGMTAFVDGAARGACPYQSDFFEGRQWQLGWDFGRSRWAARNLVEQLA